MGRWEVRQELPRSTSFWLIFLTFGGQKFLNIFGGQEEVFGKKTSVPFLLLLMPTFVEGSKNEIGVQGVPKKWPAEKIFTKIDCCGAKFTHGHDLGALDQAKSIVRND